MQGLKYYLPGSILIVIAMIIVAVPEILVLLIGASIIMAGIATLYIGHRIRKSEIEYRDTDGWSRNDDPSCWQFGEVPILRRWYRRWRD